MYTKIPHDKLYDRLGEVIELCFDGGDKSYLAMSQKNKAFWVTKKGNRKICLSKNTLKKAVKYLLDNCFFTVGNIIMKQEIGVPMGIDPAPFWANLFLYTYEKDYMRKLISEDKPKARLLSDTGRFLDDLLTINDNGLFGEVYRSIYPSELELKLEYAGAHATFLNIDITVVGDKFIYKLFDKRDTFPFEIVRMPDLSSNIPFNIFYSAVVGEFLRIARSTLLADDFIISATKLVTRMKKQGANSWYLRKHLRRIIERHGMDFLKFGLSNEQLLQQIL